MLLPFILIGILSSAQKQKPAPLELEPISTLTPTPKTSNIDDFKTISGRIVEIDPEFIVIRANGTTQNFEFDREIDVSNFKADDVVTLVFSKEGDGVMDIIKR